MKTKQRNICQGCRKGKISCDGKKPSCSQCLFRDRACPGYASDWVFIPQAAHNGRIDKARRATPRQEEAELLHPGPKEILCNRRPDPGSPSGVTPLSDLILAITSNYVPAPEATIDSGDIESLPRVCGSWVEVLPELVRRDSNKALASSIEAFAMSILCRGPKRNAPISAGLEAYDKALSSVNDALRCPYDSFPVEIAAAVMCLLLAELFLATSLDSWTAHQQGLGKLMQISRPEFYASGIPHRLFVGARPTLIVMAVMSRKSSFLATEEWRRIPFRKTPPSPVDALMSEAAAIPSILEKLDGDGSADGNKTALDEFNAVLCRLNSWEAAFQSSANPPLFWYKPSGEVGRQHIWFQSITAANAMTHLWAFRAICFRNIDRLTTSYPPMGSDNPREATHSEDTKRLSVMICQSIEYLMQDRMKLFGPTSVILPLRTAYETFEAGGLETKEELNWCKGIVANILSEGHNFLSLFFEVPSDLAPASSSAS